MVHALEKSRSLLSPQGTVLNIHDLPRPPRIEIHAQDGETFAGFLLSHTNFENQRLADQALAQVVEDGLFMSAEAHLFNYQIYTDTLETLEELLTESWETAYLPDDTMARISDLLSSAGDDAEIVLRMTARLSMLRPVVEVG